MYRWGYEFAKISLTSFIPQFLDTKGSWSSIRRDRETQSARLRSCFADGRLVHRRLQSTQDCCSHDWDKRVLNFRFSFRAVGYDEAFG